MRSEVQGVNRLLFYSGGLCRNRIEEKKRESSTEERGGRRSAPSRGKRNLAWHLSSQETREKCLSWLWVKAFGKKGHLSTHCSSVGRKKELSTQRQAFRRGGGRRQPPSRGGKSQIRRVARRREEKTFPCRTYLAGVRKRRDYHLPSSRRTGGKSRERGATSLQIHKVVVPVPRRK